MPIYARLHTDADMVRFVRLDANQIEDIAFTHDGEERWMTLPDPENEDEDRLALEVLLREKEVNLDNYVCGFDDIIDSDESLDASIDVVLIDPMADDKVIRTVIGRTGGEQLDAFQHLLGGEPAIVEYAPYLSAVARASVTEDEEEAHWIEIKKPIPCKDRLPGKVIIVGVGPEGEFLSLPKKVIDSLAYQFHAEPF